MSAVGAGFALAARRLGSVAGLVGVLIASLAVLVVALLERQSSTLLAADRALNGISLGIALPLLVYGTGLQGGCRSPALRCRGGIGKTGGKPTLRAAWIGSRSHRRCGSLRCAPGRARSARYAAAGGSAAACRPVHQRVDRRPCRNRLRDVVHLGFDGRTLWGRTLLGTGCRLLLGAGVTAAALPWPRAHIRNLLGADPVMALPQWSSSLLLFVLIGGYLAFSLWRCPR